MPFTVTELADRNVVAMDPDADFQSWSGIAADGNTLRFSRMRSGQRRTWCGIDQNASFRRLTQGLSYNGSFSTPGELVITTDQNPGLHFRVDFAPLITGLGLDIAPMPAAVTPGAPWRATLDLFSTATGEQQTITKDGVLGAPLWIGARSVTNDIDRMIVRAEMLDGAPLPVDFAINRMELLVPVGLIA